MQLTFKFGKTLRPVNMEFPENNFSNSKISVLRSFLDDTKILTELIIMMDKFVQKQYLLADDLEHIHHVFEFLKKKRGMTNSPIKSSSSSSSSANQAPQTTDSQVDDQEYFEGLDDFEITLLAESLKFYTDQNPDDPVDEDIPVTEFAEKYFSPKRCLNVKLDFIYGFNLLHVMEKIAKGQLKPGADGKLVEAEGEQEEDESNELKERNLKLEQQNKELLSENEQFKAKIEELSSIINEMRDNLGKKDEIIKKMEEFNK